MMTFIPTEADRVAAQHVRLWLHEGLTPSQMIQGITGEPLPGASPDDAHHVIAEAYSYMRCGALALRLQRLGREAA